MTFVDRWLQHYRTSIAMRWIPRGARLLDVGCHQGELLTRAAPHIRMGVGIDPLAEERSFNHIRILNAEFPTDRITGPFDVITILAVLEHVADQDLIARACESLLAAGGRVIVSVPSPFVDRILSALLALRLIHGMSLEEHHGAHPAETRASIERVGLGCVRARRFQLGLNNLFVFERQGAIARGIGAARVSRGMACAGAQAHGAAS